MKVKLVWYVAKIVQCAMMGTTEHNVDIYFKTAIKSYCDFWKEMVFCYQNCYTDREKLLKFEDEGREFSKNLRSLEQFIWTVQSGKG